MVCELQRNKAAKEQGKLKVSWRREQREAAPPTRGVGAPGPSAAHGPRCQRPANACPGPGRPSRTACSRMTSARVPRSSFYRAECCLLGKRGALWSCESRGPRDQRRSWPWAVSGFRGRSPARPLRPSGTCLLLTGGMGWGPGSRVSCSRAAWDGAWVLL